MADTIKEKTGMKLDTTTKIVTLVSVIVGIMISTAGYFGNMKLQSLESRLKSLDEINKGMDVSSKAYDLSPRLVAEFQLPLARSFAEEYSNRASNTRNNISILIPTSALMNEFGSNIPNWKSRKGLMTGNACKEGLKARQVITLIVKNIGHADAIDIKIKAIQKASPYSEPAKGWQEMLDNNPVPYYDLQSLKGGWTTIVFPVTDLRGQSSPEIDRNEAQIVLASVSGATTLFGTVLVPVEISWTNKITNKLETRRILESEIPKLRSALLGAEIGTACN
ncbi:MAG: hypothetical protein ABI707_00735 [Ferruginibacter sp.]